MLIIYSLSTKIISFIVRILGIGSGSTLPGYLVTKLEPNFLKNHEFTFKKGIILITGTNGKTTTCKLITHLLRKNQNTVCTNESGSNLVRGIITTLLNDLDMFGQLKSDWGVFEVDEFNLPLVLPYLNPKVVLFMNLSRDQLDRYGETDIVMTRWLDVITSSVNEPFIIFSKDTSDFETFHQFKNSHSFDGSTHFLKKTNLMGDYNAYNINASISCLKLLGFAETSLTNHLTTFGHAYGRGECIDFFGTKFYIFLAKNPASFNHNLEILKMNEFRNNPVMLVLNDNLPDGRDVSWIYDVDSNLLNDALMNRKLIVSGTRFLDMVIRLRYAGLEIDEKLLFPTEAQAILKITHLNLENIIVLPNYSGMLNTRKILTGRKIL